MYYESALKKTITFVESNLCEPFTLDQLCHINGFSQCHFSKLFHVFTGYTISEYIRGRRLSEAAKLLIDSDKKIIDIAYDFQFSSQDSFSRSFKAKFGITPGKYRKNGQRKVLINQLDVSKLIWNQGGREMKPEVVVLDNLMILGMSYRGKNENGEVAELWQNFLSRTSEIKHAVNNRKSYGICEPLEESIEEVDFDKDNEIKYLAGIEVTSDKDVPEGMEVWHVDHKRYAVFTHTGSVDLLGETYKSIYSKWLPASGYQVEFTCDFELYDQDFDPSSETSKMYIYIPIK